jgi:prophage tail gpP-like protein
MVANYEIGVGADAVDLRIGAETVKIAASYEIACSIFDGPSAFSIRIGSGATAYELLQKISAGDRFQMRIGGNPAMTGAIYSRSVPQAAYTELDIRGRDRLAPVYNAYIEDETSFRESTFSDLTHKALYAVGLSDFVLHYDNEDNRKAITGKRIVQRAPPRPTGEQVTEEATPTTTRTVYKTIKAELGERWWSFLERQYKRAGLFLWCDAYGDFVLSEPNAKQEAAYRITRLRGQTAAESNVVDASFDDRTERRHTKAIVYGRTSGGKSGVSKFRGEFIDDEMTALADGGAELKPIIIHDQDVKSIKEAEFVARRQISNERRENWQLEYTVSGHTVPAADAPTRRVTWAPDTIVEVLDEELGITGPHYVSAVTFRGPPTTTRLRLMRPQDLLFAEELFDQR